MIETRTQDQQLLADYLHAQEVARLADQVADEAKARLMAYMSLHGQKSAAVVDDDGLTYKATYVQRERDVFHENAFRAEVGEEVFNRYTVRKVDKKLIEQAMDTGELDPLLVGKFVTTMKDAPYLRLSKGDTGE